MSVQVLSETEPKRGTLAYLESHPNEVLTMSLEEYWENELKNEYKSEFYKNKVTAIMPYTSQRHTDILSNIDLIFKPYVRSKQWYSARETRPVWIDECEMNTYPDYFIVEESNKITIRGTQLSETTPSVIIEVLSPSTEGYDKGKKLRCYRQIPSLKQIILIAQNEPIIDIFTKNEKNEWISTDVSGIEKSLKIADKDVLLSEIYQDIDFSVVVTD